MQQEVEALLALQDDDLKIREIEDQIRSLDPTLAEFDRKREQATAALTRAQAAVLAEEKKQRELQSRLSQHRTLQERNLHQLEDVKRLREATAATAQVEATRRLMAEDESEIAILGRRINEMNAALAASKHALAALEEQQQAARPEIEAKRAERPAAPVAPPRWIIPKAPDDTAVRDLAEALSLPEIVCRLLLIRGYVTAEEAKLFLRPKLDRLHDPLTFLSMDKAVERLARAVREQELVFIHGDYDVDGICSTTILTRVVRALGGKATPFIPRRIEDGYDLSDAGVDAALAAGAKVVVTCDCGTGAVGPVARLCRSGVDVIVTDHHLPSGDLPDCLAVLNPKRAGCGYPDKDLAAVGVAFKLALALARSLGVNENFIWAMLDLVALATVADVAPLRGENRVFVRYGLRMLAETRNIGMRALLRASGLDGRELTAGRIGFILAPRLNAAGRLGHAIRGVELLLTENEHEANVIARELEGLNHRRQEIDHATLAQARERVLAMDLDEMFSIVLADESWHPGVVGIVASRLVEEFGRPTVLIAMSGEQGKGSGRSIR